MTPSDRQPFRFPSPEGWNSLVLELGLNARQAHELDIALRHAEAGLPTVGLRDAVERALGMRER